MMKRFFWAFSAVMVFWQPANAIDDLWADEEPKSADTLALPITLRPKAVVKDDVIRLGDIFSGLDQAKDSRVVSDAPAAGKDVILTADWLQKLALKHAIAWTPADSGVSITVKRAAAEISKDEILPALTKALRAQGMPEQSDIIVFGSGFPMMIPAEAAYTVSFEDVEYSGKIFRAKIVINLENSKQTTEISGKIQPYSILPTVRTNMAAGQIITESDIILKKTPQEGWRRRQATPLADLIGKEVKRGLHAGQTVDESDVRTHVMVAKGKVVTLSFTKGGIMLSAQGKALENGGLGDTVRVMNTQSKTVVQGTVTGPESVVIAPIQIQQK